MKRLKFSHFSERWLLEILISTVCEVRGPFFATFVETLDFPVNNGVNRQTGKRPSAQMIYFATGVSYIHSGPEKGFRNCAGPRAIKKLKVSSGQKTTFVCTARFGHTSRNKSSMHNLNFTLRSKEPPQ